MGKRIRKCSVFNCDTKEGQGIILHRFPDFRKEMEIFMLWVSVIGNLRLLSHSLQQIHKNCLVCHLHFKEEMVFATKLHTGVVPTLRLPDPINIPEGWNFTTENISIVHKGMPLQKFLPSTSIVTENVQPFFHEEAPIKGLLPSTSIATENVQPFLHSELSIEEILSTSMVIEKPIGVRTLSCKGSRTISFKKNKLFRALPTKLRREYKEAVTKLHKQAIYFQKKSIDYRVRLKKALIQSENIAKLPTTVQDFFSSQLKNIAKKRKEENSLWQTKYLP